MTDLRQLFLDAEKIYKQDGKLDDYIYVSNKSINNFQIAVLPSLSSFVFSSYGPGDWTQLMKLRALAKGGKFKCFDCGLCAIKEPDNAILVSDEQNQLVVPKNSASFAIQGNYTGPSGLNYNITGTVPQYYYNHLLFSTEEHIPTYAIFYDERLLRDMFTYLQIQTPSVPNLVAFFNGNFGSDTWHFHTHLTNQTNEILSQVMKSPIVSGNGVFNWKDGGIIRLVVFTHDNLENMIQLVKNNAGYILHIRDTMGVNISANFMYRNNKYWATIQIVDRNNRWTYDHGGKKVVFGLFSTSFMLSIFSDDFVVPTGAQELKNFTDAMRYNYRNYYKDPTALKFVNNSVDQSGFIAWAKPILSKSLPEIVADPSIENLYLYMEYNRLTGKINQQVAMQLLPIVKANNCFDQKTACDPYVMGRFRYIVSIVLNYIDEAHLGNSDIRDIQISSELHKLDSLNRYGNINTKYMYFRGKFVQQLLIKTIKNLLIITQSDITKIPRETKQITEWMDYVFNQIGEKSASGTNTLTNIKFPDVNMVMKIMRISSPCDPAINNQLMACAGDKNCINSIFASQPQYCQWCIKDNSTDITPCITNPDTDKQKEFTHEFWASTIVNELRMLIPNFILTYGGFMCNTSDVENKLCDLGGPPSGTNNYSYLLLENVENSNTLRRENKTPLLKYPGQAEDMLDGMMQVVMALAYGWNQKQFTHYDLHTDNIMVYNFINNKNFLKLFKIYNEDLGSQVPEIDNVLFKYYLDVKNPKRYLLIPAKKLYLVIDYGNSYVDGMPPGSMFQFPSRRAAGILTTIPSQCSDIYTFFMVQFMEILMYKPYLLIKNKKWKEGTPLVDLYYKFISSYYKLWVKHPKEVWKDLLNVAIRRHVNANSAFGAFWNSMVDAKYKINKFYYWYLQPNFTSDLVGDDFNSNEKVLMWIINKHYQHLNLETVARQPTTYVFNWGYVPENEISGIQPNDQIKELMKQKLDNRADLRDKAKRLMKQVK